MQRIKVRCGHAARRCCFVVAVVVVAITIFIIASPLESAYLYRGSMCFAQKDLSLVEDSSCILQKYSTSRNGDGKSSRSISKEGKNSTGKDEDDILCQPIPQRFSTNSSFFHCDWDTQRITCRRRMRAELMECGQGSAQLRLRSVPSHTPPVSVDFKNTCLDDVIQRTCYDAGMAVPRVVHYVHFGKRDFPFFAFVSVLSSVKFLKACLVLVHGNSLPHGEYWDLLMQLVPNVVQVRREPPTSIFNNTVKVIQHQADIVRLEALIHYGGLYLDFDVWILNSLDDLLSSKEVILGLQSPGCMCNGMFIAKRDASFLHRWYAAYQTFKDEEWAEHSGRVPHILSDVYGQETRVVDSFFRPDLQNVLCTAFKGRYNWSADHAIHLWRQGVRHFIRENHQRVASSIGEILRHILFGSESNCLQGKCDVPVVRARS